MDIPVLLIGYVENRPSPPPLVVQPVLELFVAPRWMRNTDHSLYNAKQCAGCEQILLKKEFHRNRSQRDGYHHTCILCHRQAQRKKP